MYSYSAGRSFIMLNNLYLLGIKFILQFEKKITEYLTDPITVKLYSWWSLQTRCLHPD